MSVSVTFSGRSPIDTSRSTQASAAAPAPEVTSRTSSSVLPCSTSPLRTAAATVIAVPCWSSWNTGNAHAPAQLGLDGEAFGRLDVLQVDRAEGRLQRGDDIAEARRVVGIDLDVEHVDAGELLEQDGLALHHRLAGERADVAEAQHRGAVGDHRHQVAARGVVVARRAGSATIASQAAATPGE